MKITIEGSLRAAHWETLQRAIGEMLNSEGELIGIRRLDDGVNYTAHGEYRLTFRDKNGRQNIDLIVK
jgi:hypothetical protein